MFSHLKETGHSRHSSAAIATTGAEGVGGGAKKLKERDDDVDKQDKNAHLETGTVASSAATKRKSKRKAGIGGSVL